MGFEGIEENSLHLLESITFIVILGLQAERLAKPGGIGVALASRGGEARD
ncbi:hypothetical protein [Methyloferula stellata]|nr:hypothetical protein [Methyloferula stellata]